MSAANNENWDSESVNQRYIYQEKRFIIADCQEIESSPYLIIYYADEDLLELSKTQQSAANKSGTFRQSPPRQPQAAQATTRAATRGGYLGSLDSSKFLHLQKQFAARGDTSGPPESLLTIIFWNG